DLEQRLEAVDNQARQIEASAHQQMELASLTSSITEFCQRVSRGLHEATFKQKRQLVELLIDRVVVTGEEVEIRYVIPTSPTSEHLRFCHLRLDYFDPTAHAVPERSRLCWCHLGHDQPHFLIALVPARQERTLQTTDLSRK